jgi:2-keto-4-pentenoate hydratase/2-oxohepta-3-ene-1,7-dioic acid hydratase in catechol pathway
MRLVTYDTGAGPRPGVPLDDSAVLDLAAFWPADGESAPPRSTLELLTGGEPLMSQARRVVDAARSALEHGDGTVPVVPASSARWHAPLTPGRIYAIGLNYRGHAAEQGAKIPKAPVVFTKAVSSLTGHGSAIVTPAETAALDYEAELAVVIGRPCRNLDAAGAMSHIAGYTCLNDVTARDLQRADRQWFRSKSYPTFCPLGRDLVTADEVPEPEKVVVSCTVGAEERQSSPVSDLIFGIPELIAFLSGFTVLDVGDVIATGTPSGVGFVADPPRYLRPGDTVTVRAEGVTALENHVVAASGEDRP